jgi:D-tyrosyl-tRNA(Tyr) deacylase
MRLLIQRVDRASVTVDGTVTGQIGKGLLVLLGIGQGDDEKTAILMAEKTIRLRIFEDASEKINFDVTQAAGNVLVVSQFTLYGDVRKGNRPSFTSAAPPQKAKELYEFYVRHLRSLLGDERVETGMFGAMMRVELVNDGPVTIWLDSELP